MRLAFKMKLKPGYASEYEERHNDIWPEVSELLKLNGVQEYSIFLDAETETLFAFQVTQKNGSSQDLGQHEIMQKWWNYMSDIMVCNPDNSPVSAELKEVFYMQ